MRAAASGRDSSSEHLVRIHPQQWPIGRGDAVNPQVAAVLADRELWTATHVPALLTYDAVQEADVVVTMGCGEACPMFPGKQYEDWNVDDPSRQPREAVELIVSDIETRVRDLLTRLGVTV